MSEVRLIDANALMKKIEASYDLFEGCEYIGDKARRDELSSVMARIINAPTIEPKQGHWVEDVAYGRGALNIERFVRCSECGYVPRYKGEPIIPTTGTMRFCPNCGANMKGEKE